MKRMVNIKITPSHLPEKTRKFIKTKFVLCKIDYIDIVNDDTYDVRLNDKIHILFDKNGEWYYISSDSHSLDHIAPKIVINQLKILKNKKNNNKLYINEISKRMISYKVILNDYTEFRVKTK